MNKQPKQTLTVSVDKIIIDLLRDYQNDICEKSRSITLQDLLLDFFIEYGYIDYETYCKYRYINSTCFFIIINKLHKYRLKTSI